MASRKPSISSDFSALLEKYGTTLFPAQMAEIWDVEPRTIYRWNKDFSKKRKIPRSKELGSKIGWCLWDVIDWLINLK